MDVLINKTYHTYSDINRYSIAPYYYHTIDKKYVYGQTKNLLDNTAYTTYKVKKSDTLPYLALKFYNNPLYYWVIADFNRISPFDDLFDACHNEPIKIPALTSIKFGDLR